MYAPKKNQAFYFSLTFLKIIKIYPFKTNNMKSRIYFRLVRYVFSIIILAEIITHVVMSLKGNVPIDLSEDFVVLTASVNCLLITLIFDSQIFRWSRLLSDVANVSTFGIPSNIDAAIKKSNLYAFMFLIYVISAVSMYAIVSLFVESGECEKLNQEKSLREICHTIISFWYPYGKISPYVYVLINLQQYITLMYWYPVAVMILFIALESVEIIKAKIEHMQELFEETFEIVDSRLQKEHLRVCILYHQEILRIAKELNALFKRIFGQMSFVSAVCVCLILNQMLKRHSIGATLHLIGYWVGICLICYIGQHITDNTYSIKDRVYACKWYLADPKLEKDLQLIILRSQKPIFMEAIPFGNFNYSVLITIIKTTYSYLTLINNTE